MKTIILAAGRGSRLKGMTRAQPKGMVTLGGEPLLSRHLKLLRKAGIENIALVTGYLSETFPFPNLHTFHNKKWNETQMVASLMCADTWLCEEPCLIAYADILYDPQTILSLLKESQVPLTLPYFTGWKKLWEARCEEPLSDLESFKLSQGQLTEIGQRPQSYQEIQGQFMGLLQTTPESWSAIKGIYKGAEEPQKMDMTTLLNSLLKSHIPIHALPYSGVWLEVDTPGDHALYEAMIQSGELTLPI